jgi:hypothetical protein
LASGDEYPAAHTITLLRRCPERYGSKIISTWSINMPSRHGAQLLQSNYLINDIWDVVAAPEKYRDYITVAWLF